ncbi:MAG: flagellar hook-basal body complex protein [Thiohalomonadaceae bacterium]
MAFQTSLSGLNAAQTNLSVTGNNIANASTNGFKRSRAEFADIYATSFSSTSQVGSGVRVANIGQQFAQGNVEFTDNSLDLSISGEGFFILRDTSGGELYTRAGAYQVDRDGFIVNSRDQRLQGYAPMVMGDLRIDNAASPANATTATEINLNLNANAISPIVDAATASYTTDSLTAILAVDYSPTPAVAGSDTIDFGTAGPSAGDTVVVNGVTFTFVDNDAVSAVDNPTNVTVNVDYSGGATATDAAGAFTTAFATAVADASTSAALAGLTAVNAGTVATISDTAAGLAATVGRVITASTANVTQNVTGANEIDNSATFDIISPNGTTITITLDSSVTLASLAAAIQGHANFAAADFTVTQDTVANTLNFTANDTTLPGEFNFSGDPILTAGNPVRVTGTAAVVFNRNNPNTYNFSTSTTIYDSLGRGHTQTVFFVKDNTEANTWDTYVFIGNEQIMPANPNDGRVVFNTNGQLAAGTAAISYGTFTPLTDGITGQEANPMEIIVDFDGSTQFAAQSAVNGLFQDGYTSGRISGVNIDSNGIIFARYTNGQSTALGTVALARFENPNGLQPVGDTNWARTFQAGEMVPGMAGAGSLGQIQSGALEASNVDLSAALVNMIIAQRDFQANAKMISTEDAITQTIINIR